MKIEGERKMSNEELEKEIIKISFAFYNMDKIYFAYTILINELEK